MNMTAQPPRTFAEGAASQGGFDGERSPFVPWGTRDVAFVGVTYTGTFEYGKWSVNNLYRTQTPDPKNPWKYDAAVRLTAVSFYPGTQQPVQINTEDSAGNITHQALAVPGQLVTLPAKGMDVAKLAKALADVGMSDPERGCTISVSVVGEVQAGAGMARIKEWTVTRAAGSGFAPPGAPAAQYVPPAPVQPVQNGYAQAPVAQPQYAQAPAPAQPQQYAQQPAQNGYGQAPVAQPQYLQAPAPAQPVYGQPGAAQPQQYAQAPAPAQPQNGYPPQQQLDQLPPVYPAAAPVNVAQPGTPDLTQLLGQR